MDDDDGIPEAAAPAYYYERNPGATAGPCTVPQLAVLWRSGIVAPETPLWREGMPGWKRLDACAEVAEVRAQAQAVVAHAKNNAVSWGFGSGCGEMQPAGRMESISCGMLSLLRFLF